MKSTRFWSSPAALSASSISIVVRDTTTRSTVAPRVCVEVDSAQARGRKIGWRAAPARASLSAVQSARALTIRSGRGRAHGFCDPSLDLERRHARHGPGFLFPSLQDRLRDIVAPSPLALGRVARAHPVAMVVKQLAGEERV